MPLLGIKKSQSKRILINFADKVKYIKIKFLQVDYPYQLHIADSINKNFQSTIDPQDSFIILSMLFNELKPFISIHIPFHCYRFYRFYQVHILEIYE